MTSSDVIHSFWVPNLHGKRDLIPGYTTAIWLQADQPGVYRGQCAEFCGMQHAHMALYVIAESDDAFETWRAGADQARGPNRPATKQRVGREVFLQVHVRAVPHHPRHDRRRDARARPHAPRRARHDRRRHAAEHARAPGRLDRRPAAASNRATRMPPNSVQREDLQPLLTYLESLK